jgi:spermidine synthase
VKRSAAVPRTRSDTARRTGRTNARSAAQPELAEATISEGDGVRYLHLGTPWIQGAMRIRKPLKLELDYIQRMMAWLLLRDPDTLAHTRTLQLGLGAAAITKYCHAVLKLPTTVVELNPQVIHVCRQWFHLPPDDDRLTVVQGDAAAYVNDPANLGSVDALCVDLYDHEAASPVLDDEDFYRACWQVLDDGGVMTVNLFGREASFDRSAVSIAAAFGVDCMAMLKPTPEGNVVVLAWKSVTLPPREILQARAEILQSRWDLPAKKWVKLLSAFQTPAPSDPQPTP